MQDCIFCKIVAGEIPSFKLYENNDVLVFLDAFPFSKGHMLVIPKKHFTDIHDIDEENLKEVIAVSKRVADHIKKVLNVDGIRVTQSNGSHAGQAIFHIHFHLIPRYHDDGLHMDDVGNRRAKKGDPEELKKLAEKLKM